ncbi:hypothetical protein PIB30_100388 [Stylosanthes scabra]|uniref:Uncharacterized protein n=1 Tax=Stylosanthes scabra TaxID=79078 RepID=A0ABU6TWN8_9FABA|nr:hypothetical protein [Stylosanthes scabra]
MSRLLPDHVVQRLATGPGRVGPITDLMSSLAVGQTCIICICLTLVVIACVIAIDSNNIKITLLCGFVTILVLHDIIGVNFSSSDVDAVNQSLIEETNRILRYAPIPTPMTPPTTTPFNVTTTFSLGPKISNCDQERQ